MALKFYYAPMSTAVITNIVLEELGVPVQRVKLSFQAGDTKKPDFLKVNPNGKVPVIVHDDMPIWESAAITMYLGEMFGVDKKLYPAPGPKRGEAMKWIVWANVTLGDAVGRWTRNTMEYYPVDQHNAKAGAQGRADIDDCLAILDRALVGRDFLLGDYTLVDTHLNSFIDWLRMMKLDLSKFNQITAWGQRCCERPAYKRTMTEQEH